MQVLTSSTPIPTAIFSSIVGAYSRKNGRKKKFIIRAKKITPTMLKIQVNDGLKVHPGINLKKFGAMDVTCTSVADKI